MRSIRYPRAARILRVSRILRAIPARDRITRLSPHHAAHGHRAGPAPGTDPAVPVPLLGDRSRRTAAAPGRR